MLKKVFGLMLIGLLAISCMGVCNAASDNINIPDPLNLIKFKSGHTWTNNELYYYFKYSYHVNTTNLYEYLIFNGYNSNGLHNNSTDYWITPAAGKFLDDLGADEYLHVKIVNNTSLNNSLEKFNVFYKNNSNKPNFDALIANESYKNGSLIVYNVPNFKVEGVKPGPDPLPELNVTIPPLTFGDFPSFNIPSFSIPYLTVPSAYNLDNGGLSNPGLSNPNNAITPSINSTVPDLSKFVAKLIEDNVGLFLFLMILFIISILIIKAIFEFLIRKIFKYVKKLIKKGG
ncbi:MAG: hypothetical protein LBD03_06095 [Methanobrevibacter sp.]|jgi:hypothetical protein|nr:hypothetical protein [Candidatus Methanovirga procula]